MLLEFRRVLFRSYKDKEHIQPLKKYVLACFSGVRGSTVGIKAVYDSADKYKDAIALGSISLNECDELGGIVTKLFEEKLDINDGRNIDNKYTDIKQVIQWTIFKMPKPMEDMIMQQYKIQQQMEAQHVFDSVKAVQDSDGAVSPVGGKGPGSLRVVKK